jgi:hypothetical protein
MKSYEVIRKAVDEPGVKAVAARLKVSAALVYKWCEPQPEADDPDQSGARNPLDRVRELYRMTNDIDLVQWICHEAGGFFVTNPDPARLRATLDESIFTETRGMVRDFSELLDAVTSAHEDDPGIDAAEAETIRTKWEDLKTCIESFVVGCEKGIYKPRGKR